MAPVNGLWKWLCAILVAIMLAGAPGIVQAVRAPTAEEVNIIRERQYQVLQRLAVVEEKLQANQLLLAELQKELREHETQARR